MPSRLLLLSLFAATGMFVAPTGAPAAASARLCRPVSVVGHSVEVARRRLAARHCHVRVRRIGDMGRGPLRVVQQSDAGRTGQRLEVSRRDGPCRFATPYWKEAASNDVAVVAHTGQEADELWVCVRGTGQRRWLGHSTDAYPDWDGFAEFGLAGHWLAYEEANAGRTSSGSTIVLVDLEKTRAVQRYPGPHWTVAKELVVNEAGDTAWSSDGDSGGYLGPLDAVVSVHPAGGPTRQVLTRPTSHARLAPLTELAIDATTVRWHDDGVPASAQIRPPG